MAALTALFCSTLLDIYDLTDGWLWNGLTFRESVHYLQTKRRLELFRLYCREAWLREAHQRLTTKPNQLEIPQFNPEKILLSLTNKMNKDQIDSYDFIRAESETCEAIECLDIYDKRSLADNQDFYGFEKLGDDIEVITGIETNASFYEYNDTSPVYVDPSIGPLKEGFSITVKGTLPYYCEKFSINFIVGNAAKDIAFHVNPRLPQNYIVRNTKVKGVWGCEEVASTLPFTLSRGASFSIQVLVTKSCYMISVNGHHFAEYAHRLPYETVNILEVKGDVENVLVEKSPVDCYPQRSADTEGKEIPATWKESSDVLQSLDEIDGSRIPTAWRTISPSDPADKAEKKAEISLPYYGLIPKNSLKKGRCLRVEGRVRLLPQSFYINLQQGQNIWPHPIIALHFNPRFSKHGGAIDKAIVCRNAWYNDSWDKEERSELVTDFRPGKVFCLSIVCDAKHFKIYLNKKFMLDFRYRIPLETIDTVYIQGDIKLWNVSLEDYDFSEPDNDTLNEQLYNLRINAAQPNSLQKQQQHHQKLNSTANESFT